jgi:hypothetical protein
MRSLPVCTRIAWSNGCPSARPSLTAQGQLVTHSKATCPPTVRPCRSTLSASVVRSTHNQLVDSTTTHGKDQNGTGQTGKRHENLGFWGQGPKFSFVGARGRDGRDRCLALLATKCDAKILHGENTIPTGRSDRGRSGQHRQPHTCEDSEHSSVHAKGAGSNLQSLRAVYRTGRQRRQECAHPARTKFRQDFEKKK